MSKCYFLVHKLSYRYVKNIADYIFLQLKKHSPLKTEFQLCESVEDVPLLPNSTVYIIGDPFTRFTRAPGCKYVFMNFSVLYLLGNPFNCSLSGYRLIKRKRKIFEEKLDCYDYILDFWPAHTARMRQKVMMPVNSFPVAVTIDEAANFASRRQESMTFVSSVLARPGDQD